jgi:PPOX class probable F420-dependent enzyme
MPRLVLEDEARRFVASARVGRLATATAEGRPHVIPVCFEVLGDVIYVGLDAKPKSVDVLKLRRVQNLVSNPQAALIVDRYSEDWSKLGYVLITAEAGLASDEGERYNAIRALRSKYAQYQDLLPDDAHVIRLRPLRVTSWGDLTPWGSSQVLGTESASPEDTAPDAGGIVSADV